MSKIKKGIVTNKDRFIYQKLQNINVFKLISLGLHRYGFGA